MKHYILKFLSLLVRRLLLIGTKFFSLLENLLDLLIRRLFLIGTQFFSLLENLRDFLKRNFIFKNFLESPAFLYFVVSVGFSFLCFFGCVSIWDNHLDKVHFMEMEILDKNQLMEIELLEKKKAIEIDILEKKKAIEISILEKAESSTDTYINKYLPWVISIGCLGVMFYWCYTFDVNPGEAKVNMDIANFSKIEVMYKHVQIIYAKVLDIQEKVFELYCNVELSIPRDVTKRSPLPDLPDLPDFPEVPGSKDRGNMDHLRISMFDVEMDGLDSPTKDTKDA